MNRRPSLQSIPRGSVLLLAGLGLLAPAGIAAANSRQPIDEIGSGTVTDDPCVDGRPGRCGFTLKGNLDGVPADETFFSVIDDDGAATPDRCVRAHYAGLLGDGPDQSIGHVANGRLCPDGAGGYVFEGHFRITGGLGPFDGASGGGDIVAQLNADGSATLTVAGHFQL